MPTDYSVAGGLGVRLGGEVADEYTGGRDFSADVGARRVALAQEAAARRAGFGPLVERSLFNDTTLLGNTPRAAYRRPDGQWVNEGTTGIPNIGAISATRFALDDLPAKYQSAYGPVRLARDVVGQGYLAVPIDAQGEVKFYSPPADYEVPSLSTLQARQMGRGILAGASAAPGAALDMLEAVADVMDGAFNPSAKAQSTITQGIRDGRITGSSLLYGLVESSPVGIMTNMGIGTPESLYAAGQSTGGAAMFGAAGLTLSSGLRLSTKASAIGSVDFMEGAGRLGGELYNAEKLAQLSSYLERRDISLKVGDHFLPPGKLGGFSAIERSLVLRDNPTNYEVWHELTHYQQFARLGEEAYSAQTRLMKEQYVFDKLESMPRRWNSLTPGEVGHARTYIYKLGGLW